MLTAGLFRCLMEESRFGLTYENCLSEEEFSESSQYNQIMPTSSSPTFCSFRNTQNSQWFPSWVVKITLQMLTHAFIFQEKAICWPDVLEVIFSVPTSIVNVAWNHGIKHVPFFQLFLVSCFSLTIFYICWSPVNHFQMYKPWLRTEHCWAQKLLCHVPSHICDTSVKRSQNKI